MKTFVIVFFVVVGAASSAERGPRAAPGEGSEELSAALPRQGRPDEYVSSGVCRECHPKEYESWHATYHRTMTQAATPNAVVGRFDRVELESRGMKYLLERRGEAFWVEVVDSRRQRGSGAKAGVEGDTKSSTSNPPRVRRRVVMTTGSHHMQAYWVQGGRGRELLNFPFLYLIDERRWIPREDGFLRPPDMGAIGGMWNDNCIDCHSVGGQPRLDPRTRAVDTRVAELGVACEACHGPGKEHVRVSGAPRAASNPTGADAASRNLAIVNPAACSPQVSSQICGQCHGVTFVKDVGAWLREGFRYRPGADLEESRYIPRPARGLDQPWLKRLLAEWPTFVEAHFWADGMIRVSGREYNGLIESPCFAGGQLSCLSCHSMHRSHPDDQLARGRDGNEACLQCHEAFRAAIQSHTHHPPDSPGSNCYNCHMPYTTYGLLRAMRSHQIDSPRAEDSVATGRPNACNLCHLDKTLAWTSRHLSAWYGARVPPQLRGEDRSVAASLSWLLSGDAGQRALIASSMGWKPALEASGRRWQAPFLAQLLVDPYAAVRFLADRSLRRLPGYESYEYDFVGPLPERAQGRQRALDIWSRAAAGTPDRTGRAVLIDADGELEQAILDRLLERRDDRPVNLAE